MLTQNARAAFDLSLDGSQGQDGDYVRYEVLFSASCSDLAFCSIGVSVGSSIQIANGVVPFLVILGWILDQDLTVSRCHVEVPGKV